LEEASKSSPRVFSTSIRLRFSSEENTSFFSLWGLGGLKYSFRIGEGCEVAHTD
jgi:hypothetical protein